MYRDIFILFPDGKVRPIKAQYVQITKNGKYVLNYLEKNYNNLIPSFTEIIKVDNEWGKNPFHDKYEEYEFLPFNRELSESIINELPNQLKFKIRINDDRKDIDVSKKLDISSIENNIYYVLTTEDNLDIPYPVFTISGKNKHSSINYEDDVNKDADFNEIEFSRFGLSTSDRNKIKDYLNNKSGYINLSSIEIENDSTKEKYRVNFVLCPDIISLSNVYRAKSLYVDYENQEDLKIEELLMKAFNNEIPLYYESEKGTKWNNGIKHESITK